MKQDRMQILEEMPVKRAILTLAIPTIISMMIQALYNIVDTFFIGKLNDPNQIAGVSLAFPIVILVGAIGSIFAAGGASYISRALGRKDHGEAKKAAAIAFYSTIVIGIIASIVILIFIEPVLYAVGASPNTIGYAKSYLTVILVFCPVMLLQMILSAILRSEGAAKQAMIGNTIGTIANIILDPLFIFGFGMGVTGAAIATVIAGSLSIVYNLSFFIKKESFLSISPRSFGFSREIYADIIKVGIASSVGSMLLSVTFAYSNSILSFYGDKAVAANGVVMKVGSLAAMTVFGLAMGYQPLAGFNYGAKNYKRMTSAFKVTALMGTGISVFFSIIFFLFSKTIMSIFIDDPEVIRLGSSILKALVIGMVFLGLQTTIGSSLMAFGKGLQSLILSLGRQGLLFIVFTTILNNQFGFYGFIFAQPCADITATILAIILFLPVIKSFKKEMAMEQATKMEESKEIVPNSDLIDTQNELAQ